MSISLDNLPNDPAELKHIIADQATREAELISRHDTEKAELRNELHQEYAIEVAQLKEQIRLLLHQKFGRSAEAAPGQGELFDEAEAEVQAEQPVTDSIAVTTHRRKRGGRRPLPEQLARIDIVCELDEAERCCPKDGTELVEIGEDVSEQLDYIPAQAVVLRIIRKKCACPQCEEHVVRARAPVQLIPKSQASNGLLAHIAIAKYQDALPLYRQEQIYTRLGVELDRTLMANWMVKVGAAVQPLIDCLRADLQTAALIHGDETTVQVLKEPGRRADQKSYMWVQASGTGPPIVLYHYASGRSRQVVQTLYGDYRGTLVTDGYAAYDGLSKACHAGCWAHVRRRFHEALKAQTGKRTGKVQIGFNYVQKLFALERQFKALPVEARFEQRQLQSKPVLEELRGWLDKSLPGVPPQSLAGKALGYLNSQWHKLIVFVEDGTIPLSNNLVENKIRPFVIGRKNWMFSDSVNGANASAAIYSLIETVKANDMNPALYLRWLFHTLPTIDINDADAVRELLPYRCDQAAIVEFLAHDHLTPGPAVP